MVGPQSQKENCIRVMLLIIMLWQTDLMLMAENQDCLKVSSDKSSFHILHMQVKENTEQEKIT